VVAGLLTGVENDRTEVITAVRGRMAAERAHAAPLALLEGVVRWC